MLCVLLLLNTIPAFTQVPQLPSTEQRVADLAFLWQETNYNFVHFDKVSVDWDSTFQAFIPEVLAATTAIEHVRILQRFIALLNEGHANVVPTRALRLIHGASPPVELLPVGGRPLVVNTGNGIGQDIPIGSEVLLVNGVPADKHLRERVFPFLGAATYGNRLSKALRRDDEPAVSLLSGLEGTFVIIGIETPAGERREVELERLRADTEVEWSFAARGELPIFELEWLPDSIARVNLNGFHEASVVDQFEAALPEIQRARGVVFDVRRNRGGSSSHGWAIGRHFIDDSLPALRWRARENVSVYRAWGRYPSRSQYAPYASGEAWIEDQVSVIAPDPNLILTMPVAVLIGPETYSAAEDFVAFMKSAPRATLFGENSGGSTGQPLILKIGSTAWAAITAKRDMLPDGTDIVGVGVPPDVEVHQTISAFRAGRDLVLEAAQEFLAREGR